MKPLTMLRRKFCLRFELGKTKLDNKLRVISVFGIFGEDRSLLQRVFRVFIAVRKFVKMTPIFNIFPAIAGYISCVSQQVDAFMQKYAKRELYFQNSLMIKQISVQDS